jgi:hypothetical protein
MSQDGSAFIRLAVARHDAYVGESVPVSIEVGMRAGVVDSLDGLPTLDGSDFTLNNLSRQPERNERMIDGKPFIVFTWHSVLAPVKSGDFSLSVQAPMKIRVSTRPRQEALLEDQLGDPFMQRIFGATVLKAVKAASPPLALSVMSLPVEGRPSDFSGAVGQFKMSTEISSAAAAAGDPLTLRMHVVGAGNFDRVDSPMLDHVEGWKTYPPTSSFKSSDALGFQGEKTFEQPVIASRSGVQTLPALSFAYFDPALRRYETLRSPPISVSISASPADALPGAMLQASSGGSADGSSLRLRPDRAAPATRTSSLAPLYLQPRFLALPSLLALIAAAAWLRRDPRADFAGDAGGRRSAATRRALAELEAAAHTRDSARFFALARRTVQEALAARWQMMPGQVTAAEVDTRLGVGGEDIRQLLILADEANYAGRDLSGTDFVRWTGVVRSRALSEPSQ